MANRILKDSIRTSKSVNLLSDFEFRLWTYLITYVDDFGRGSADAELLKGFVFPRRKGVTELQIKQGIASLANKGMIVLYDVGGDSYFYFPNWANHQRIQAKRAKYPTPGITGEINQNTDATDDVQEQNDDSGQKTESTVGHGESPYITVGYGEPPYDTVEHRESPLLTAHARESESESESESVHTLASVHRAPVREHTRARGKHENVLLTEDEYDKLGRFAFRDELIDRFSDWLWQHPMVTYAHHYEVLEKWGEEDKDKQKPTIKPSFDIDEFFNLAVQRATH